MCGEWQVFAEPVASLCPCMRMRAHGSDVCKTYPRLGHQHEAHRHHNFMEDPQFHTVGNGVQRCRNPTFNGVLDRQHGRKRFPVADSGEGSRRTS